MKKIFLLLILISSVSCSQTKKETIDWLSFSKENITTILVNKTKINEINDLIFDVVWDDKLGYSENLGHYGGVKSMMIYKDDKILNIFNNMEDNVGLGEIIFNFYDYNLDGYIDFTVPLNCGKICWKKYYLFNPELNKFEHKEDWDYLRIQKIDKKNKQILSQPDGMEDNRKLYQIEGLNLIELKL